MHSRGIKVRLVETPLQRLFFHLKFQWIFLSCVTPSSDLVHEDTQQILLVTTAVMLHTTWKPVPPPPLYFFYNLHFFLLQYFTSASSHSLRSGNDQQSSSRAGVTVESWRTAMPYSQPEISKNTPGLGRLWSGCSGAKNALANTGQLTPSLARRKNKFA